MFNLLRVAFVAAFLLLMAINGQAAVFYSAEGAAQNTPTSIELRGATPPLQTQGVLQASRHYVAEGWFAAKREITGADRYLRQAIKTLSLDSRTRLEELSDRIHAMFNASTRSGHKLARRIRQSL